MLASKILALFSCVLLVTSVCGSMRFITYMSPTSEYGTVATITSNFTHSIVECISTNDYRVVLNSTQFWTTDSVTNRSVFYTIIDFVDPSAADALLNAPSALQLLVAFNAVLVAGTTNTRYVTYLAKWGLFNYYAPGLTTPAPTTVVTTHAPANTTTPAPVPITSAPTPAPPNNTAASVGEVAQDNSVVLGVVFGILGCIALVGGAIFVVKKFVMRKKKVKSSGGGYAKRAAQV